MVLKVGVDDGNINGNYRCGRQGLIAKILGTGEGKSPDYQFKLSLVLFFFSQLHKNWFG